MNQGDLEKLIEAVGQTQAKMILHGWILREIMIDLARAHPDPAGYVAKKFETISGKADQLDYERHPQIDGEIAVGANDFFSYVRRYL